MKKPRIWRAAAACLCAAAALGGCGGGGGGGDTPVQGAQQYTSSLPQAGSAGTLLSASFQDAFASGYLDAGTDKAQLLDAMKGDATVIAADAGFSGFPNGTLSDVSITDCNASHVCTLTGTLTNGDADSTSIDFSTLVVLENGAIRVLGDQKNS